MNIPADSIATFLVCTFSMLAKVAEADGEVSASERDTVENYINEKLKLDPKHTQLALKVFDEALDSPLEIRDYAERFQQAYRDLVQPQEQLLKILVEVSGADGILSIKEDEMIRSVVFLLEMPEAAYQRIKETVFSNSTTIH